MTLGRFDNYYAKQNFEKEWDSNWHIDITAEEVLDRYQEELNMLYGVPFEKYDDTMFLFDEQMNPLEFIDLHLYKTVSKPLAEQIKKPDDITGIMYNSAKDEQGLCFYDLGNCILTDVKVDSGGYADFSYKKTTYSPIKVSPIDFAVWAGVASKTKWVKPYLVYLDVDGDSKSEELALLYNYPYADWYAAEHFEPPLEGHFIKVYGGYVINPFDSPEEDMGSVHKLVYIENPNSIKILPNKTIPWYEVIGKTPAEIGLDKDDRGIFGRIISKTPSPAQTTPSEIPEGEEKGIPGFEVIIAIIGLLTVVYVLRRWNK